MSPMNDRMCVTSKKEGAAAPSFSRFTVLAKNRVGCLI